MQRRGVLAYFMSTGCQLSRRISEILQCRLQASEVRAGIHDSLYESLEENSGHTNNAQIRALRDARVHMEPLPKSQITYSFVLEAHHYVDLSKKS